MPPVGSRLWCALGRIIGQLGRVSPRHCHIVGPSETPSGRVLHDGYRGYVDIGNRSYVASSRRMNISAILGRDASCWQGGSATVL